MTQTSGPDPQSNLPEFTVSELSKAVKRTVEDAFGYVRVRGELSQPKIVRSGHFYGRLKDENAVVEIVCWRSMRGRLKVDPEDGMEVVITGRMTTYAGRSQYQLIIESMELAGEGALLKLLEERKQRLAAEGLFAEARKAALPYLPDVVGVVSSPTGAVIRDILHRLNERFPRHVLLWPVAVQGEGAAEQVVAALKGFNALPDSAGAVPRPDVLLVARGGGSLEDLMAFNEESVVRAIAGSAIPVISAVGHETDTTLADYGADRRAPTPSAAAEIAVPVRAELHAQLLDTARRLIAGMQRDLVNRRNSVTSLARGLGDPKRLLENQTQRLDERGERLDQGLQRDLERRQQRLAALGGRLRDPRQRLADTWRQLERDDRALKLAVQGHLRQNRQRLEQAGARLSPRPVQRALAQGEQRSQELAQRLARLGRKRLDQDAQRLANLATRLESVSYQAVLQRGFALVRDAEERPIKRAGEAQAGQAVTLQFHDDRRGATLDGGDTAPKREKPEPAKPKRRASKPAQSPGSQGSLF